VLLVVGDAVFFYQCQKILGRVAGQRAAAEVRILRHEVLPAGVDVGEVAAAAAGDADLLGQLGRMVDQHHALAALGRHGRAHHAGRARADYRHIVLFCHPASATIVLPNPRL
jgi:hypothetical protein